MRILVNDIVAVPDSGGPFSILMDFYEEVKEYSKEHPEIEWIFLLSGEYIQETRNIKVVVMSNQKTSWIKRLLFELVSGRKFINRIHPDVYFSMQNTMTMGVKAEKYTYLHQSLSYQTEVSFSLFKNGERKLWIHQRLIGGFINYTLKHSGTKVIVQTKWMKKAITSKGIVEKQKVRVLPPNNVRIPDGIANSEMNFQNFFYPATGMKYKNHIVLFQAAQLLEAEGYQFNVFCTLTLKEAGKLHLPNVKSVHLLGRISRDKVWEYYSKCVLTFPSLTETYGLPLLEARMMNTFILTGNTEFGQEILEDYDNKAFFDPHKVMSLRNAMIASLENEYVIKDKNSSSMENKPMPSLSSLLTERYV